MTSLELSQEHAGATTNSGFWSRTVHHLLQLGSCRPMYKFPLLIVLLALMIAGLADINNTLRGSAWVGAYLVASLIGISKILYNISDK
jgi:hypothetical protein